MCFWRSEPEILTCYTMHISRLSPDSTTCFSQLHGQGAPCLGHPFPVQGQPRALWPKALVSSVKKNHKGKQFPVLSQWATSRGLKELFFRGHQWSCPEKAHQHGATCYRRCCTVHFCTALPANYTPKTHQPCENTQTPSPAACRSLAPLQPGHWHDACDLLLPKRQGKKKKPITGARHCCLKAHDSPTSTWYQKTKPNPPAEANCCSCRSVVLSIYHNPWAPARATSAARDRVRTVLTQVKTSPVPLASSCSHTWEWMHKWYFLNKLLNNKQTLPSSSPLPPRDVFLSHLKNNVSYAAHLFLAHAAGRDEFYHFPPVNTRWCEGMTCIHRGARRLDRKGWGYDVLSFSLAAFSMK